MISIDKKRTIKNSGESVILQIIGIDPKSKPFTGEIKILKNKMEDTYLKIQDIDRKICKLRENLKLLEHDRKNEEVLKFIEQQKNIINYFKKYFDNYTALFLNAFL